MRASPWIPVIVFVTGIVVAWISTVAFPDRSEFFSSSAKPGHEIRETVASRQLKYSKELVARLLSAPRGTPIDADIAHKTLRAIHETEIAKTRNPNARRQHNAAMQNIREIIDAARS